MGHAEDWNETGDVCPRVSLSVFVNTCGVYVLWTLQ